MLVLVRFEHGRDHSPMMMIIMMMMMLMMTTMMIEMAMVYS